MGGAKYIWLPEYSESKIILEKYLTDITYLHHVIHIPSMRALLEELYSKLGREKSVPSDQATLLLSIIANTAQSWTTCDADNIFTNVQEAQAQVPSWAKATMCSGLLSKNHVGVIRGHPGYDYSLIRCHQPRGYIVKIPGPDIWSPFHGRGNLASSN